MHASVYTALSFQLRKLSRPVPLAPRLAVRWWPIPHALAARGWPLPHALAAHFPPHPFAPAAGATATLLRLATRARVKTALSSPLRKQFHPVPQALGLAARWLPIPHALAARFPPRPFAPVAGATTTLLQLAMRARVKTALPSPLRKQFHPVPLALGLAARGWPLPRALAARFPPRPFAPVAGATATLLRLAMRARVKTAFPWANLPVPARPESHCQWVYASSTFKAPPRISRGFMVCLAAGGRMPKKSTCRGQSA